MALKLTSRSVVETFEINGKEYRRYDSGVWEYFIGSVFEQVLSPDMEAKLEASYQQWLKDTKIKFTGVIALYDAGDMWIATCDHPDTCDTVKEMAINPLLAVDKLLNTILGDNDDTTS